MTSKDQEMLQSALWHISNSVTNGKSQTTECEITQWLRSKINSLPEVKQLSERLGDEIDHFRCSDIFALAKKAGEEVTVTAQHFAEWQKEQMMKNCLYETEVMMHTRLQNTEYLILSNRMLPHIPISFGLNVGDKVKILIIKEDEQ